MPFRIIGFLLLAVSLSLGFTSCNSDDDGPVVFNVQEFATFVGNDQSGAHFQVQRTGNGPVYDLYAKGSVNESNIKAGSRVLIAYQLQSEYNSAGAADVVLPTSGQINVISVNGILTLKPKVVNMEADSLKAWDLKKVYLDQLNRTGVYINFIARVECDPRSLSTTFDLFADSASLTTSEPKLYLRYNQPSMSNVAYVPGSLDLVNVVKPDGATAPLWGDGSYNGVVVNVANSKTTKTSFQFLRSKENYTE